MPFIAICGGPSPQEVMQDTWGHLAPEPKRWYSGFILFGYSAFGDLLTLDYDFEELPGNPWTHEAVDAWVDAQLDTRRFPNRYVSGEMRIYRWEGAYRRHKNGRHQFAGKVRPQRIVDRFKTKKAA